MEKMRKEIKIEDSFVNVNYKEIEKQSTKGFDTCVEFFEKLTNNKEKNVDDEKISVDRSTGTVYVQGDPTNTKLRLIRREKNKTGYGGRLNTMEFITGLPQDPSKHLLLNDLMNCPHSYDVFETQTSILRSVKWFAVGTGADNPEVPYTSYPPYEHDTHLYSAIPFVCRTLEDDLTPTERVKYRLRVIYNFEGRDYVLYYLKVIDDTTISIIENGKDYTPVADDTRPDIESNLKNVEIYANLTMSIDNKEFHDFYKLNHNGSSDGLIISELALVTGVDQENELENNNLEVAGAELVSHVTFKPIPLTENSTALVIRYELSV